MLCRDGEGGRYLVFVQYTPAPRCSPSTPCCSCRSRCGCCWDWVAGGVGLSESARLTVRLCHLPPWLRCWLGNVPATTGAGGGWTWSWSHQNYSLQSRPEYHENFPASSTPSMVWSGPTQWITIILIWSSLLLLLLLSPVQPPTSNKYPPPVCVRISPSLSLPVSRDNVLRCFYLLGKLYEPGAKFLIVDWSVELYDLCSSALYLRNRLQIINWNFQTESKFVMFVINVNILRSNIRIQRTSIRL